MNEMDSWQAAQFADELNTMRQVMETLEASKTRALTEDEIRLLAWASGVQIH